MQTFDIQVQDDHLQRISQVRKPIHAVAELIWNAVDADADRVDVMLHDNALGGFRSLEVVDNGHGIPYAEAEALFSRLGGSWKQGGRRSREKGRLLHGKEGRGRFRAFSLGRVVDWHVCYAADGGLRAYDIMMVKDHPRRVQVEDEAPAGVGRHSGVAVVVSELDRVFRSLREPSITDDREVEIDEPVRRADGRRGIVDLMFTRNIQLAGSEDREHLVVELKRPDMRIDAEVAAQIEGYAFAVADDERFRGVPAKWVFWAVSSDLDQVVSRKVSQRDRARGILFQDEEQRITIWVKTWSQIINDCRSRLRFFEEKLNYTPDRDSSRAHLRETYHKYLADLFAVKAEPVENEKPAVDDGGTPLPA